MICEQKVFIGYAIILFLGGLIGFKKGSKESLIAGSASAVSILFVTYHLGQSYKSGLEIMAIVNGILVFTFLKRLLKTKKFMPAGMLLALSVAMLAFAVFKYLNPSTCCLLPSHA